MRTPRSLAGRITVLLAALAIIVGVAASAVVILRPEGTTLVLDPGRDEPYVPVPFEGAVIARVDGEPIYLVEAQLRVAGLSSLHGDVEDVMGAEWPERILSSLVEDHVVLDAASEAGLIVTEGEVTDAIERVKEMAGSGEAFDAWLSDQDLSLPDLERRVWMQILSGEVYEAVTADAQVTGPELREYYRANRDAYVGVDGVALPFIAVRSSLRTELLERRRAELFSAWLEEARKGALVEIVNDDWWKELT